MPEPIAGSVVGASALPAKPSLEFLRKVAKDRVRAMRADRPETRLFEAQLLVARQYGFNSWRELAQALNPKPVGAPPRRENGRVWIEGIEPLAWSRSGPMTFCGALEAILKVVGPARSYATLLGDSGLAFRPRLWASDDRMRSCPSSPVGEFFPWTELAAKSVGLEMRWESHLEGVTQEAATDMAEFREEVTSSIDAGLPLLTYAKSWDMGIAYGYEDEGRRLLVRDYHIGDAETVIPIGETRGLFAFLSRVGEPLPRERAIRVGLANNVETWGRSPERASRFSREGAFHFGADAYARWIELLGRAGAMDEEGRRGLFMVNHWTFIVQLDARRTGSAYLTAATEALPASARAALASAAEAAREFAALGDAAMSEGTCFAPFYRPEKFDAWTDAVRSREAELIDRLSTLDARIIRHLSSLGTA